MKDFKTIIEFGTSKITCAFAQQLPRNALEVLGCAQIPYAGIKKDTWVDNKEVIFALEKAIDAVEMQVGTRIRNADVGIPGPFLKIKNGNAQIPIKNRITGKDVNILIEKARNFEVDEDMTMVQEWPAYFLLDDGNIYLEPYNLQTQVLRSCISYTMANKFFISDAVDLLNHLGVTVDYFIPEPLAQGLYLLTAEKRDSLAVMIDIGYYATGVSLLYGDAIIHFTSIPMGGGNITNDISYVMKVEQETAEQLKRRYTFGLKENNSISYLYAKNSEGKLQKYPYDLLKDIIDARVEHIITYVTKIISRQERSVGRKIDVYITGGGINFMPGAASFFRAISNRVPNLIKTPSTKLQTPDKHTAYALMQYAFDGYIQSKPLKRKKSLFGKVQDVMFE